MWAINADNNLKDNHWYPSRRRVGNRPNVIVMHEVQQQPSPVNMIQVAPNEKGKGLLVEDQSRGNIVCPSQVSFMDLHLACVPRSSLFEKG